MVLTLVAIIQVELVEVVKVLVLQAMETMPLTIQVEQDVMVVMAGMELVQINQEGWLVLHLVVVERVQLKTFLDQQAA